MSDKSSRFGRILREARLRKGVSGRELARKSGIHQSYISKFESGQLDITKDHLNRIADALALTISERSRIFSWQKLLEHDFSPFVSRSQVAEGQSVVKQIESSATLIKSCLLSVIPGLLQTREYMEAIFATESYSDRGTSVSDIRRAIAGRIERQAVLENREKRFSFLIHESAIRNRVASKEAMEGQLSHLCGVIEKGSASIGIISMQTEWKGELPLSNFHIYDEELVLIELFGGVLYLYYEESVKSYYRYFDKIQINALYGKEALEYLGKVRYL